MKRFESRRSQVKIRLKIYKPRVKNCIDAKNLYSAARYIHILPFFKNLILFN